MKVEFSGHLAYAFLEYEHVFTYSEYFFILPPVMINKSFLAVFLLIGDEAVNAEDHTTICGEEEPAYRRSKTEYAQRERERHKEYLY